MSILIKGMEMPGKCEDCPCYDYIDYVCRADDCFAPFDVENPEERSEHCPLIEIRTPHGRLIDADELENVCMNGMTLASMYSPTQYGTRIHTRSGGEQVVANCKDCTHVEVCRYYTNELAKANGIPLKVEEIEGLCECDDCEHFKDRSRLVELPCDIISKAEIKRELSAQCAVKKIDVETAKDMLENLPYIRVNTKQELKERENNA